MSEEQSEKRPDENSSAGEPVNGDADQHHKLEEALEPVLIEPEAGVPIDQDGIAEAEIPEIERDWAAACHASALLGLIIPLANILMPLAIWLLKSEEMPFVQSNGKEAVNFQITLYIGVAVCALLTFVGIGWALLFALGVYALVAVVKAAMAAKEGQHVHYKLCIRFIS